MAEEEDLDESLLEVNDRSDVRGVVCGDTALRRPRMLADLAAALNATEEIIIMQYYYSYLSRLWCGRYGNGSGK